MDILTRIIFFIFFLLICIIVNFNLQMSVTYDNIHTLEATIENAKREYALHMRNFLLKLRSRLNQVNNDELDEMILYVTKIDYNIMKEIVHKFVLLDNDELSDNYIHENVCNLYNTYKSHFRDTKSIEIENKTASKLMDMFIHN